MAYSERLQVVGAGQFCGYCGLGRGLLVVATLVEKAGKGERRAGREMRLRPRGLTKVEEKTRHCFCL